MLEEPTTTLVVLQEERQGSDEPISIGQLDSILTGYETKDQSFWTQVEKDNNVMMAISVLSPPSKYGIEVVDEDRDGDLWGYFTRSDQNTDAVSQTYELTAWKVDKVARQLIPRHQSKSLHFTFNAGLKSMVPKSPDAIQVSDPIVEQEFLAVTEDAHTFLKDEVIVKTFVKYIRDLFDATKKYLLTGNDDDIFYSVLKRSSFHKTESRLRRDIWDVPAYRMNNFIAVLAERQSDINKRDGIEAKSFDRVLKVLMGFIRDMHHDDRIPKIVTKKAKTKPEKQPTIRFNDEVQYMNV